MSILVLLIAASLLLATGFLLGFIWAVRSGQYEDTATPAMRVLLEEPPTGHSISPTQPDQRNS
jgi:cbb3-type cytochrome oxidase maturation protein